MREAELLGFPLPSWIVHGTMLGCIAVFAVQVPFYTNSSINLD
jgi:hypothetical protein